MTRVELITREGCHLCAAAQDVVADVCGRLGESYDLVDVDTSPELVADFGWDVPVVRVDGRVLGVHRIDAEALEKALSQAPGAWRPW